MVKKKEPSIEVAIEDFVPGEAKFYILGKTPVILNRVSQKAMRELLLGGRKKNRAEKESTIKHNPLAEFRASPYVARYEDSPTYLQLVSLAFKGAMKAAALDMPGYAKSETGRRVWVDGERVGIYGIPKLFMAVTRNSDIKRTPDVRTRCIVPEWACELNVKYVSPLLTGKDVARLMKASGILAGVGDWRNEKGAGTYGQYEIVNPTDPRYQQIVKTGGYAAQKAAMDNPQPYDDETEEMLSWFAEEVVRRGIVTGPVLEPPPAGPVS